VRTAQRWRDHVRIPSDRDEGRWPAGSQDFPCVGEWKGDQASLQRFERFPPNPHSVREGLPIDALVAFGVQCRFAIGRSSVVAAGVLFCLSADPDRAFEMIAKARGVDVPDNEEQQARVTAFADGRRRSAPGVRPIGGLDKPGCAFAPTSKSAAQTLWPMPARLGLWRTRSGRPGFRGHRNVMGAAMARRTRTRSSGRRPRPEAYRLGRNAQWAVVDGSAAVSRWRRGWLRFHRA
jgi:hypothetical protein